MSVRELKALARQLNVEALAAQLGPFVLVQRPYLKSSDSGPDLLKVTRPMASKKRMSVLDFEDLWVATLPPLTAAQVFEVGRSPDCELLLEHETVSKRHARITWRGDHAELVDLGSSNGTFLNGSLLRAAARLKDNDGLDFGAVQVFYLEVRTLLRRMRPGAVTGE